MKTHETSYTDGHREPSVEFPFAVIDGGDGISESSLAKFRRAILFAHDARNSKKSLACMLIAIGDPAAAGVSITTIAKRFKVSKQDISNCCQEWCKFLSIPPSSYMREESTKKNFQANNHRQTK